MWTETNVVLQNVVLKRFKEPDIASSTPKTAEYRKKRRNAHLIVVLVNDHILFLNNS